MAGQYAVAIRPILRIAALIPGSAPEDAGKNAKGGLSTLHWRDPLVVRPACLNFSAYLFGIRVDRFAG